MDIEFSHVYFRYPVPGDDWAIRDINLRVQKGERIALIGPAASGKTTIAQLLDALILPTRGDILFNSKSVLDLAHNKKLVQLRRSIGILFQFPEHQFSQENAYEELVFGLRRLFSLDDNTMEEMAKTLLNSLGMDLDRIRQISPFSLSSGEKRKLAIASAIIHSPELLVLDEPMAGLDIPGQSELLNILDGLDETTMVIATHNLEDFLGIVTRVVGIYSGTKIIDTDTDGLFSQLDIMEHHGITPPLVLQVQSWLKDAGIAINKTYTSMEELINYIKELLGQK